MQTKIMRSGLLIYVSQNCTTAQKILNKNSWKEKDVAETFWLTYIPIGQQPIFDCAGKFVQLEYRLVLPYIPIKVSRPGPDQNIIFETWCRQTTGYSWNQSVANNFSDERLQIWILFAKDIFYEYKYEY